MWKCPKCGRGFNREGQSHFCGKIETIDQYIEEQEEKARPYLNEVRQILRAAIPEAEEKIYFSVCLRLISFMERFSWEGCLSENVIGRNL